VQNGTFQNKISHFGRGLDWGRIPYFRKKVSQFRILNKSHNSGFFFRSPITTKNKSHNSESGNIPKNKSHNSESGNIDISPTIPKINSEVPQFRIHLGLIYVLFIYSAKTCLRGKTPPRLAQKALVENKLISARIFVVIWHMATWYYTGYVVRISGQLLSNFNLWPLWPLRQ
jgi:hypothetical protein